jgi:hypothetical protein
VLPQAQDLDVLLVEEVHRVKGQLVPPEAELVELQRVPGAGVFRREISERRQGVAADEPEDPKA